MAKRLELLVINGPFANRRFKVPPGGLRLGRSSSSDMPIPDEELSRNHCLFEPSGEDAISVTDLASANGTLVNGELIDSAARVLSAGDMIEVGATRLRVVGDEMSAPNPSAPKADAPKPSPAPKADASKVVDSIDLGLGHGAADSAGGSVPKYAAKAPRSGSKLLNLIFVSVAVLLVCAIVWLLMLSDVDRRNKETRSVVPQAKPSLISLSYEKVEADARHIFRYAMSINSTGELSVVYDDLPQDERHVAKTKILDAAALKRVAEILETPGWRELDSSYSGSSAADLNELKSVRIRTVCGETVREVLVENTLEPPAFQQVREALETFSRNELAVWALEYSRDKLLELSLESERVGDAKWEERDVEYGNLSAAFYAYNEAVCYLDTVNPKPNTFAALNEKMNRVKKELDDRFRDQSFKADKAIKLSDWEVAREELRILCDMVPDKRDSRHNEANAKLVDVENRLSKQRKKSK